MEERRARVHNSNMRKKKDHQSYLDAVTDKRIKLFGAIQAEQVSQREKIGGELIKITLPDGSEKEGKKWVSSPLDIANEISSGLAANALIAQVNGELWDMTRPLEGDCELKLFRFEDDEGRDTFWHSSAHILGQSLEREYGCKLCIGPCTTRGEGFYYDAFYGDLTLNEDHFKNIKAQADKAVAEKQPFERIEVSRSQALEMFAENQFKMEIINELPEDKKITVYRCGPLVDLCRGPHIPNTSFVRAFACLKASSSYWKGKADRESLQRVYGISYPDQKRLKEYLHILEEAKKRDHRVIGPAQELFFFNPVSPGSCFFLPHGKRVCNKLVEFIRYQYRERGYDEVETPIMYNMELWETSGHAANYKENMFVFEVEEQEFGLKPMNCPGHCLMFDYGKHSYIELPLRYADFGVLHRNELSGALSGLTRVRKFQQDDAHIFCRESQVKDEVKAVLNFIDHAYKIFGFTYELELSTRPEKYLGEIETWDKAESALSDALNEFGKPWKINEGDGAFYGPKIDIGVFDALKRKFQCATLQLDFQLPLRFKLSYSTEDETKLDRPVMIHRAVLGSVERMFAILLEHYRGKWPFWLSPRQVIICSVSNVTLDYAKKVREEIRKAGFYVDIDESDRTINKKVREAQLAQYNYILVVGAKEADTGKVCVRVRDEAKLQEMCIKDLINKFKREIEHVRFIEAKQRVRRAMRPAQDLFFFNSLSPGSCFLLPDGKRVFDKLMEFIKAEYWKRGYDEVGTSMIYNMQLWETSNYKEKMFMLEVENQKFGLKPMNGPDHCLVFNQRKRSYRELPLRYADFGVLHKNEPSGEFSGLTNIRKFQEDDALIFCRESQVKDEVKAVLDFIDYVYTIFGFTYELELSTRPDKYVGEIETWNKTESALSDALSEFGKPWKINEGGGAYHGPKIDIGLLDSLQRKFQCATLQLDFELPLIFKLTYSTEDESKFDRPVIIHRAVLGSLERIFEILLKNYKGKWPLWLSPRQVIVCSHSSVTSDYAIKAWEEIHEAGFDVDIDESDRAVEKKVEEAQLAKYNYILVVGEKEVDAGKVCVRVRDEDRLHEMSLEDLTNKFKSEVESFK